MVAGRSSSGTKCCCFASPASEGFEHYPLKDWFHLQFAKLFFQSFLTLLLLVPGLQSNFLSVWSQRMLPYYFCRASFDGQFCFFRVFPFQGFAVDLLAAEQQAQFQFQFQICRLSCFAEKAFASTTSWLRLFSPIAHIMNDCVKLTPNVVQNGIRAGYVITRRTLNI